VTFSVGQKDNNLFRVTLEDVVWSWVGLEMSDGCVQSFVQKGTLSEEFQVIQALSDFACECSVAGWVGVIFEG
jgi:hypothetical protein